MDLSSDMTGEIKRYIPRMEVSRPGADKIALTGSVEFQPIEMLTIALTLSGITKSPIVTKCELVGTIKGYNSFLFMNEELQEMDILLPDSIHRKRSGEIDNLDFALFVKMLNVIDIL